MEERRRHAPGAQVAVPVARRHPTFARTTPPTVASGAPKPVREAKSPAGGAAQGVVTFGRMLGDPGPAEDRNRCVS